MRYVTKEIYETMQKTSFHLLLRVNKKAETFDENFYRKLYAKKLTERLKFDKECSEVKFEDIFDEEFDFESKAAYEQARREYKPPVFDESKTKREFAAQHKMTVKLLQNALPKEILERTADIRILALDVASAEVKRLITAFCKENERKVRRALKELHKAEEREFGKDEDHQPEFMRESLHDCEVLSCRMKGKDLVMELDSSGGFTAATGVIFRNAEIIEREGRLIGAIWLYDEVYKRERGLEIHALLWYCGLRLRYLTVRCESASYIFDETENG